MKVTYSIIFAFEFYKCPTKTWVVFRLIILNSAVSMGLIRGVGQWCGSIEHLHISVLEVNIDTAYPLLNVHCYYTL